MKTATAVVDCFAASTAYYLACQAHEIVLTPSSEVGSVGKYLFHMNHAKMLSIIGIEPVYIAAGRFKTEANPHEALADSACQHLQSLADSVHNEFVDAIVRGRGRGLTPARLRQEFGEGRVVRAADAIRLRMADRLMPTPAQAYAFAAAHHQRQAAADQALVDAVGLALNGVEVST